MKHFLFILFCAIFSIACQPLKKSVNNSYDTNVKNDASEYWKRQFYVSDSLVNVVYAKMNSLKQTVESAQQQINENVSELIDKTVVNFDSSGNKTSEENTKINRSTGKNIANSMQKNTSEYVTIQQFDSLFQVKTQKQNDELKAFFQSELNQTVKEQSQIKTGINWLQKTLMYIGIAALAGAALLLLWKLLLKKYFSK